MREIKQHSWRVVGAKLSLLSNRGWRTDRERPSPKIRASARTTATPRSPHVTRQADNFNDGNVQMLSMTKDTPTTGGKWEFLLNWDQKQGKQSRAARYAAKLTAGKVNVGGKPSESDLDIWIALYRDKLPKRLVVGWNPTAVPGAGHTGDNQTGAGDDDEKTWADLDALPAWVTELVVGVSTKPNGSFGDAMNVGVKVVNDGTEVDELMPTLGANENVAVTLVATRNKDAEGNVLDGWKVRVLDAAGRYQAQVQPGQNSQDAANTGILAFAKNRAGF